VWVLVPELDDYSRDKFDFIIPSQGDLQEKYCHKTKSRFVESGLCRYRTSRFTTRSGLISSEETGSGFTVISPGLFSGKKKPSRHETVRVFV
jgi:hypothetical protein